jgi:hypothetical protein
MARLIGFLLGVIVVAASCGGAQHRKVTGPPPEYELPDPPDAAGPAAPLRTPPRDAGLQ